MKTAIILGATGMTGNALLHQLLEDNNYDVVKIFVRKHAGIRHPKLREHIVNFDVPESWKQDVTGDALFSAFGTTLKKAGSKEAQYKIDHTYQYNMAKTAADNGVPIYVLVSAAGSSEHSVFFYPKMKGELERDVKVLPFQHIHIMRPGLLSGNRAEKRVMETISDIVLQGVSAIPGLKALKPIKGYVLARAMRKAAADKSHKINSYSPKDIFALSKS